uniref:NADH-ubiquinone oxidoreductase chain 6 n=1 Tax=Dinoderus minutus TaxID=1587246 RepID=A0A343C1C2_9COLE|nr:NADH dehydrogenase subunit 6 [Dinoderus minutus]
MMLMNLVLSTSFIMLKHPMSMAITLILSSISVAMSTGILSQTFWFSYIMFMIMVGGMLVMIIYMTSIASNEKFKKNILIPFILMIMLIKINTHENSSYDTMKMNEASKEMFLIKFFNFPMMNLTIMIMIYLLMTLIVIVKITSTKSGPLRQKY